MKRTELPKRLQELLTSIPYVTIATVSKDGQPWNSPVVGRFDADLNLYWVSWKDNQHSQNIDSQPCIFVVVYDSQTPEGTGEGLYLQMRAHSLDASESLDLARQTYRTNFFKHPHNHRQFLDQCPQRMYKAIPERIWHNGDGQEQGHFVDVRHELTMSEE